MQLPRGLVETALLFGLKLLDLAAKLVQFELLRASLDFKLLGDSPPLGLGLLAAAFQLFRFPFEPSLDFLAAGRAAGELLDLRLVLVLGKLQCQFLLAQRGGRRFRVGLCPGNLVALQLKLLGLVLLAKHWSASSWARRPDRRGRRGRRPKDLR